MLKKISKKIAVIGMGYVGLSNAILLGQNHNVHICDIIDEKVKLLNNGISPIVDKEIDKYLTEKSLHLSATNNLIEACEKAEFIIIATPTNYNPVTNYFDTSSVECVLGEVKKINRQAVVVIKSTVPIGFTERLRCEFNCSNILFSPEFLREGKALWDNLYPSRIVIGTDMYQEEQVKNAEEFAQLLKEGAVKQDIPKMLMSYTEAEAIKLFANTYLAMRVAFFNELDTFAEANKLNSRQIIEGICFDQRIGEYYNNPSFGYGGYCLPKDSKQLLANYQGIPNELIKATVNSNKTRLDFISNQISHQLKEFSRGVLGWVGIYRLTMKADSDNFRESAVKEIIKRLNKKNIRMLIFEPSINEFEYEGIEVVHSFEQFKERSTVIIANRFDDSLKSVMEKVYTRDLYCRD